MSKNRFLVGMIGVMVGVSSAFAQPVGPGGGFYWTNPVDGNWFQFDNWNFVLPATIPPPNPQTTAHMAWTTPYTVTIENGQGLCHHLSIANSSVTLHVKGNQASSSLWTYGTELNNDGLVLLNATGANSEAILVVNSHCTLRHAGILRMAPVGTATCQIRSTPGLGYLMIHDSQHIIEGAGSISVRLQNDGQIRANVPGGKLTFDSPYLVENNSTIVAMNGGQVWLALSGAGPGLTQSNTGQIVAQDGSSVWLQSAGVDGLTGGQLDTSGTGAFNVYSQSFRMENVTLTGSSLMQMVGNSGFHIGPAGMTNHGLINLGATGFLASDFGLSGPLSGTGRVQLEGGQLGKFLDGFSYTIVNNAGHTIGGFGSIQAHVTNNGTIAADRNGMSSGPTELQFSQAPKINHGLITATGTGTINFFSTQVTQNSVGTLHADDGSWIALTSSTVTGGKLSTSGTGVIVAAGSDDQLNGVTLTNDSKVLVPCGRSLNLAGTITNHGTIHVENASCGPGFSYLRAPTGAAISGNGEIHLARLSGNAAAALWGDGGPSNPMIVGAGQSITGSGSLYGTININGVIAPSQTANGSGPIGALDTAVTTGGGSIALGAQANLEIDIGSAAAYDRIQGNAAIALDGMLDVSVISGFQPAAGNVFTIVTGGSITGSFDNAVPNGGGVGQLVIPEGSFVVTYSPTSVTLSGFTPGSIFDQGDMNCDGSIDGHDVHAFVVAVTQPAAYAPNWPHCNILNGDMNNDMSVNAADAGSFAALVIGE